ncbi:MAG: zinc dependent phospholipase C family protein [Bacteroidia bacterium]|nr:zinc dependent phospholipase C family protein [Bacteroidia bacterium]
MIRRFTMAVWLGLAAIVPAHGWGFWAHQRINRLAVFTLPPEMIVLYKKHIEYLTDHAVDPDMRRYAVDGEAARHYMDLDRYGKYPFENLPRQWKEAVALLTEDTLQKHGILPYHLPMEIYRLKQAFEDGDIEKILKISADMGHYVGDAHVPLHTTANYNGQLTGQKGIHGFWESRLPELFGEKYDFLVGRSYYIDNIRDEAWTMVLESHLAVDSVLGFERALASEFPADQKYGYESRNNVVMRMYSREYSAAYHERLDGMVERRMRTAIRRIGACWYTAWKMAGSPDLAALVNKEVQIKPEKYNRKLKIQDREAQEVGWLMAPAAHTCCTPHTPAVQLMGGARLAACTDPATQMMLMRRRDELNRLASRAVWQQWLGQVMTWFN